MNNMTGDPNRDDRNRPSIFGFESYPSYSANPIDWSRIPSGSASPASFPPPGQFNYSINYEQSQNFSFCTTQTPHPAHFPFPPNNPVLAPNKNPNESPGPSGPLQSLRCKRKTNSPPTQSCKQLITEEKMAEHMSRLHISSETEASQEPDSLRTQRLYMCEEMRKLQTDSIIPQSLLSRIQRPCTALVLWTPPRALLQVENEENGNNRQVRESSGMDNDLDGNDMDLDNV